MKIKSTVLALSILTVLITGCSKKTEEHASEVVANQTSEEVAVAADASTDMVMVTTAPAEAENLTQVENTEKY